MNSITPDISKSRFYVWTSDWRLLTIGLPLEAFILGSSFALAWFLSKCLSLNTLCLVAVFYLLMVCWTLIVLKLMRVFFPLKEGIHSFIKSPMMCINFLIYEILCSINLNLIYDNSILPTAFKPNFYKLMGVRRNQKGAVVIAGMLAYPNHIVFEGNAVIGRQALLQPYIYTIASASSSDLIIIGRIVIKSDVLIGVKSLIMPGVTIGENTLIQPMSFVPMNTKIPPNEIWGGNPAKKIGDMPK